MATVLVVDDSATDRHLATRMLEGIGLRVVAAPDGEQALEHLQEATPDIVLTDLQMPNVDGLALVKRVTADYPAVPVVVMTAFGSEEVAVNALQTGAASYVPKHNLARDLVETVKTVLAVARAKRETLTVLGSLCRQESEYILGSTLEGLDSTIAYIKDVLQQLQVFGEAEILRVGTALYEALVNAVEHGNLEIDSQQREAAGGDYRQLLEERATRSPFQGRHIRLITQLSRDEVVFKVSDEGRGFDPGLLPDPTDPGNVGKVNGRGLFLIRTFMDEVSFNDAGNEITMVKRRSPA